MSLAFSVKKTAETLRRRESGRDIDAILPWSKR
jgi:hypothetical protein